MLRRIIAFMGLLGLGLSTAQAGDLVGPDKWFVRFTNVRSDAARIMVRVNVVPNDEKPFDFKGVTVYVGKDGPHDREPGDKKQWLEAHESSPWLDIGQYMMLRGGRSPIYYLSPVLCGILTENHRDGLHVIAEVARGPGIKVARRIEVHKPEIKYEGGQEYPWRLRYGTWNGEPPAVPTLGLMIPTLADVPLRVYTLEESLNWQLEIMKTFPRWGRQPEQIVFQTSGRDSIKRALGYNGYPKGVVEANLGDEIQIAINMPKEERDRRFREHLKARGFDPLEFMSSEDAAKARTLPSDQQWSLVHLQPPLPDKPKQFYEAANFRYALWHEELGARARKAEAENPGKRVLAGANFTPAGSGWPDVRHWISPFKSGQFTMSWTEDWWWQIGDPTPQTFGFQLDALRLAGSYHGAPLQFYVMPFAGQSPDHFRRMNTMALAHGTKILNHFHTEDQVLTTWDYIDLMNSPPMYQAIHDVIHEVGAVEHRLYGAMPAKAQVAIMLSRAGDTWDTEDLGGAGNLTDAKYNVNSYERKALWLALRQAQIPVDLITDEDIAEGKLTGYRALYMVGSEMLASAAGPLEKWVRQGGYLYATAGGGLLDEYRQPIPSLLEMYGLEGHDLKRVERQIGPRHILPKTPVLDVLNVTEIPGVTATPGIEGVCYRETLQPSRDARVVGTYKKDGAVGAVVHDHGKGRTIYVGVLAGLAFLKPAMILEPSTMPTAFVPSMREFLVAPARWAKVVPPIEASDPLVETQYMTGPDGAMAIVINWRQQVNEDLVLRFPGLKQVKNVRSLRKTGFFEGHLDEQKGGGLKLETVNGVPQVHLRLELTDYLLIDGE